MNESKNNFEALRRLLALKRNENPPPGYFNRFSGQVIARIRAGEASKSAGIWETPWLAKFLQIFEARPAFAGAFASALVAVLFLGIVYADRSDTVSQPLLQTAEFTSAPLAAVSPVVVAQPSDQLLLAPGIGNNSISSLQPVASMFGQQNPFAQQVSFSLPGN